MKNEIKRAIKNQVVSKIQSLRRMAKECGMTGDWKNENAAYRMVNEIREFLHRNDFETKSFAGGLFAVCGVTVEIVAHRRANWDALIERFGLQDIAY